MPLSTADVTGRRSAGKKRFRRFSRMLNLFSPLILLVIWATASSVVFFGPFRRFLRNDTVTMEGSVSSESNELRNGSQYPTIVVCQLPGHKTGNPFDKVEEANATDIIRSEYYGRASELVEFVSFWFTTLKAPKIVLDPDEVYTKKFHSDCTLMGMCFSLDLGELFFRRPDITAPAQGEQHLLLVTTAFLSPSGLLSPEDPLFPTYLMYFMDQDEEITSTGVKSGVRGTATAGVRPRQSATYTLDIALENRIRECNVSNTKVTACLTTYLDSQHNSCSLDDIGVVEDCTLAGYHSKCLEQTDLKFRPHELMTVKTGCMRPCKRFSYTSHHVITENVFKFFPAGRDVFPSHLATLTFTLVVNTDIKELREEISFPLSSFVAEVGGYIGLFLGWSLWSIYKSLLALNSREKGR